MSVSTAPTTSSGLYADPRVDWLAQTTEEVIEPKRPIVDPHHHLWDRPTEILRNLPPSDHGFMDILHNVPRYLVDELLKDLKSGHNVIGTIYMECGAMYRAVGLKAVLRAATYSSGSFC